VNVLKTFSRFVLLVTAIPPSVFGIGDCVLPPSLCERLNPGMVVFIGKQVSLFKDQYGLPTVTFDIQEQLWGPSSTRVATVFFEDGYLESNDPQFLAVTPTGNGHYRHDDCGRGLLLPLHHQWVQEFRRNVTAHRSATVPVAVHSSDGYVPVAGTEVQLSNNGRVIGGRTRGTFALVLEAIPPGDYQVTATKRNFTQAESQKQVSILPGSCAPLKISMAPVSALSGHIVDSRGEPVRNTSFHLMGKVRPMQNESIYDSVGESVRGVFFRMMSWGRSTPQDYSVYRSVRTDDDGRFFFPGVFPGRYYLVSDIARSMRRGNCPFPRPTIQVFSTGGKRPSWWLRTAGPSITCSFSFQISVKSGAWKSRW
jgi:hypothetical protein